MLSPGGKKKKERTYKCSEMMSSVFGVSVITVSNEIVRMTKTRSYSVLVCDIKL